MAYESESPLINGTLNNSIATANPLLSGVRMNAALGSAGDKDYFSFTTTGAAAIMLDFVTDLVSATDHWQIRLLDGNGDYLQTLATSSLGAPVVQTAATASTSLAVSGLSALPAAGSRFTLSTSGADTTIYTVVSATSFSSGQSTLELDKAITASAAAALVFDPAQLLTGVSTQLSAQVAAAGKYYVEVLSDGAVWTDSNYQITTTVKPTTETEAGDSSSSSFADGRQMAVDAGNRLLANTSMTGALSSATDADYWVFTTTAGIDFNVAFASASGSLASNEWKIDVTEWSGATLPNNAGALTAGTARSVDVSHNNYPGATTFVVKVSATSPSVYNTGTYSLKVSGASLDLNDAPVLTVGAVSSATPNAFVPTGVVKNISTAATDVLLSSLFSVSDPDVGQTIDHYIISLTKAAGTSSGAYIHTATVDYGLQTSGMVTLTAAQMASALFVPGSLTGDLSLTVQAFDSTGALDSSGNSALLQQTLHIVSGSIGVLVGTPGATALSEDASLGNHSTTFSLSLAQAPSADVQVYLRNANTGQLDLSSALLTFTAGNYAAAQIVTVTAYADGIDEGASQAAGLDFQVVSTDANYDGFVVKSLAFTVADPVVYVNHAPSGNVSISHTLLEVGQVLNADTSTLADADGLGVLSYQWQRSTATGYETVGTDSSSYTLAQADNSHTIRVKVSYTDGGQGDINHATAESVTSAAVSLVINLAPVYAAATATASLANHAAGGTLAYTAQATDGNGDSISYSLSGADRDYFDIDAGAGTVTLKSATDWSVKPSYSLGVVASDGSLSSTQALTISVASPGVAVAVQAYDWKNHTLLSDVSLDATHSTGSDGSSSYTAVTGQTMDLTPSRAIPPAEASSTSSAVNLQDAIAILKMIVGLPVNGAGQALSPYQALAADFNGDGTVGLTDAIGVLKHVVGLTAPDPTWHFLNEADASVPGKANLNPGLPQSAVTADLSATSPVHVGLVAYLSGDVDGSYAGAVGAADLDVTQPGYFATLVGNHPELDLSQFGM